MLHAEIWRLFILGPALDRTAWRPIVAFWLLSVCKQLFFTDPNQRSQSVDDCPQHKPKGLTVIDYSALAQTYFARAPLIARLDLHAR